MIDWFEVIAVGLFAAMVLWALGWFLLAFRGTKW